MKSTTKTIKKEIKCQNKNINADDFQSSITAQAHNTHTRLYTNESGSYIAAEIDIHCLTREEMKTAKFTSKTEKYKEGPNTHSFDCRTLEMEFVKDGIRQSIQIKLFGRD